MRTRVKLLVLVVAFAFGIGAGIVSASLVEPPRHVHIAIQGESIEQQGGIIEIRKGVSMNKPILTKETYYPVRGERADTGISGQPDHSRRQREDLQSRGCAAHPRRYRGKPQAQGVR